MSTFVKRVRLLPALMVLAITSRCSPTDADEPAPGADAGVGPDDANGEVVVADAPDGSADGWPDDANDGAEGPDGDAAQDVVEADGGEESGAAEACLDVQLTGADAQDWPGTYGAGAFEVTVDADRRLRVTHTSAPGRVLFATPAGSPLLTLGRTAFEAEEHQGSFSIAENILERCDSPHLEEVLYDGRTVALRGRFAATEGMCAGLGFEIRLCEIAEGHLGFRVMSTAPQVDLISLHVESDSEERIYGLGEQFPHDTLNLKGRSIPVLAQEGGIGRGHALITPAVNLASPGSGGSESSTYYAVPQYLTNRLRSLFLENTEYAVFDFSQADATEIRLHASEMRGRVLYGETPLELIERFTEYAGRMPPIPDWANQGAILALARELDESKQIVEALRTHGAEIAGVWNQTWSGTSATYIGEQVLWNWVQNPHQNPGWGAFVQGLDDQGIRVLCYVNSMFRDPPLEAGPVTRNLFKEGLAGDYFVHNGQGEPYLLPITAFEVGLLDLTNPDARAWMKDILKQEMMANARCSGWMADFAEALPYDAVLYSGETVEQYHNRYPVEWAKLNREALEEAGRLGDVLVFHRSGHTRTPAYATLLWQGDQLTTWDKYDGLSSALHGLIGGGFSGIALNHSDTGGYTSLSQFGLGYSREEEQLKRWAEMNAFTTVLRTHEGNQPGENAQVYSDNGAMAHFARMTKVYKALAFYREALFAEAASRGWPVVRHLMMHYPQDEESQRVDDEFLLGSEILVAPIKNKCWTVPLCPYNKEVYFPPGEWVHLWTGAVYGSSTQGTRSDVAAPIGKPAVFYRRGSGVGAQFVQNLLDAGIAVTPPSTP